MVNPSWGNFKRPQNLQEEEPEETVEKNEEESPEENVQKQWGDFKTPETYQGEPDPKEEESTFGSLARNVTSLFSRGLEIGIGARGNTEKFAKDVLTNYPKSGGVLGWALSELMGPERWERMIKGPPGQQQILPTSEQLKEFSQKATGGYTTPKTPGEKKIHGFAEDIASTFRGGPQRIGKGFLNNQLTQKAINHALIPAAANVTKSIVEDLGFGEDKANLAKLAVWTPLSLAYNVNSSQYASDLMNQGRNGIPQNLASNVHRLQQRLQTVSNSPHLLHADPRTALARQQIAAIERDISNGQTSVRSLMTSYDGLNAAKRSRDLFSLSRGDQAFARRSIDEVRNVLRDEIIDSAQMYPQAINSWTNGVQAWATIHRTKAISNYIEGLVKGPYGKALSGPALALFGVGSYGAAKIPLVAGPVSAAIPSLYKTGQVLTRILTNEPLKHYYWNALMAASRKDGPLFVKEYNKLNKELEKSDGTSVSKSKIAKKSNTQNTSKK